MPSIHEKLGRVRKPRVHITYDVETEGAVVQRELPFVVGVLGDFSGNASTSVKPYKERKFIQIDRDNFNDIMSRTGPKLNFKVENTLVADGSQMEVDLSFNTIEDFEPAQVVGKIEPLKMLLEARNQLRDLLTKADRSEVLEGILEDILKNQESLTKVAGELGIEGPIKTGETA